MSSSPSDSAHLNDYLDLLRDIASLVGASPDLRQAVPAVLRLLMERTTMRRATLTLVDGAHREIFIEEAVGLSAEERERGRYRIGEGITGRVVATGAPMIVPRVSESPEFLNRTRARTMADAEDWSYVCVPVVQGRQVVGTLSVDVPWEATRALDRDTSLLQVVGTLLGQGVVLRREAAEELRAIEQANLRASKSGENWSGANNIVGRSKAVQRVYELVEQVARASTTVMITGESGTGKELVASAIHYASSRSSKPFIRVNCGALPEGVIDSELFGHEKGAFTGAIQMRKGRFEMADGGTLFLDEVGELTLSAQVKLLRVLQEREFERVGGTKTVKVDVRVITATSRQLEQLVESGRFRPDLYYRLNVFPIHMPPLRDRKTDITLLADHFVAKYNNLHARNVRRISTSAIDMLTSYHWPGNVRELENCIERAILLSTDDVVRGHHLPPTLQTDVATGTEFKGTLQYELELHERTLILDALKSTRGNMAAAARMLGITERIIGLRVGKYGIDNRRFRPEQDEEVPTEM
jgi:Nif-specific regulatory protein